MLPAYNTNGFYVIIFYSYETLNLYLFGNMVLATINNAFSDNLKVIIGNYRKRTIINYKNIYRMSLNLC